MDPVEILAKYDAQARANIPAEPGIHVDRSPLTVRISGLWDCVIHSQLDEETANAAIALEQARPLPSDRKLEWKLYGHDQPSDLGARLRRAGFEPESRETLVAIDLQTDDPATPVPPDVSIRSVDDPASLADVVAVGIRAFGQDFSSMNGEFLERVKYGTVLFFVAYREIRTRGLGSPRNTTRVRVRGALRRRHGAGASRPRHLQRAGRRSQTSGARARLSLSHGGRRRHELADLAPFGIRAAHDGDGVDVATSLGRPANRQTAIGALMLACAWYPSELEVLELVVEQARGLALDHELRQRQRLARELLLRLLEVVQVQMAVAARPHELAGLEIRLLRHHVRAAARTTRC